MANLHLTSAEAHTDVPWSAGELSSDIDMNITNGVGTMKWKVFSHCLFDYVLIVLHWSQNCGDVGVHRLLNVWS